MFKSFDDVVQKNGVYLVQSSHGNVTNNLMASSPRHPFWKIVMKNMMKNTKQPFYMPHQLYILTSTGTSLIKKSMKMYQGDDIYIFDKEKFNPCSWCEKTCKIDNDNVYTYTTTDKTWNKGNSIILNHFYCRKNYYIILLIFISLCYLAT